MNKAKKTILFLVGGLAILSAIFLLLGRFQKTIDFLGRSELQKEEYVISGVPLVSNFNHVGRYSYLYGDTASAAASILEYWNPEKYNLTDVGFFISRSISGRNFLDLSSVGKLFEYIDKDAFKVSQEKLENDQLKKYINSETRTPLLLFLPVDENQPMELTWHPAWILIGVNEKERTVVLQNSVLGADYVVSFDQLEKMWERMRPEERHNYLVIQPKNIEEKMKEIESRKNNLPVAQTSVMREGKEFFKNASLAKASVRMRMSDLGIRYGELALEDPSFKEYIPPCYKMELYLNLARLHLGKDEIDKAIEYAEKSVSFNYDLNKPFKDFPGFEYRGGGNRAGIIDRSADPYKTLGIAYHSKGDYEKSVFYFKKAIEISDERELSNLLQASELERLKK